MLSQNILNLVDTAMVGHVPQHANEALGGVNLAAFVHFMSVAFITGLSSGVQAIAARRKGEGRTDEMAAPLNGGLVLAVAFAVPLTVVFYFLAPIVFPLLQDDPLIVEYAVDYYQVRILAMTAVGMNFAFRGYWNGVDLSRLYMRTIVIMHVLNVFLNAVLIYGLLGMPALGSTGAAVGTAIATTCGALYYIVLGLRHARAEGFLRSMPPKHELVAMLRLALPTCIQQLLFATGMTGFITIVGTVGTEAAAAAAPLINLTLVGILPGMAFGIAAATLVGQALGRGDPDDAARWGWQVARLGSFAIFLLTLPVIVVPDLLLLPFLTDPAAREVASLPLRLIGMTLGLDAVGIVLQNALLGAGATKVSMFVSIAAQYAVALPLAFLAGPVLGGSLTAIWGMFLVGRMFQMVTFVAVWRRGRWRAIKV